jgi:putative membrane protein
MSIKSTTAILFASAIALAAQGGNLMGGGDDNQKFFEKAASANTLEVESGRLASYKASNPQLKAYGQQMVADHSKATQELQALATKKGMTVPIAMSDADQKTLDKLRDEKSGKDFDKRFRDVMIDSHEDAVSLFEDTAKDAKDPEVKAFAQKMLPTLHHHEQQAKALPKA